MRAILVTSQSAGVVSSTSTLGYFLTTDWKPRARPCAPVWPSAPWVMMTLPLPPMASTSACVTEAPMNSLSGARKLCTSILSSGAISVSMSITGMPASIILFTGCGQRADAEGLDGDEIPFLGGHVVDGGALLGCGQFAVEPGDVDVEQLAPVFGGLLALGAPGGLQAGVGEGGLQRLVRSRGLLGHIGGEGRVEPTEQGGAGHGGCGHPKEVATLLIGHGCGVGHLVPPRSIAQRA